VGFGGAWLQIIYYFKWLGWSPGRRRDKRGISFGINWMTLSALHLTAHNSLLSNAHFPITARGAEALTVQGLGAYV